MYVYTVVETQTLSRKATSQKRDGLRFMRGYRRSPMELKMVSNVRGITPSSEEVPCMVYVLPELVTP